MVGETVKMKNIEVIMKSNLLNVTIAGFFFFFFFMNEYN